MKIHHRFSKYTLLAICSGILSGCVAAGPYPYYGGSAPYYGTTVVPGYAYGGVNVVGGYYPYYRAQHIYSPYNNGYWQHQRATAQPQGHAVFAPRGGEAHGNGGDEHR